MTRLACLALGCVVTCNFVADAASVSRDESERGEWQRIELQSPSRNASLVEVLIQTAGPSMAGLIRIPGSPPSNFDTGNGKTVVDLINAGVGSEANSRITAVEVQFTRVSKGQTFFVIPVGYRD
jgi:hypothetical protein